jgi:hypothetical protein
MSEDIRKMIDKIKNFKQFLNEQNKNENDIKILANSFLSFYIQEHGYSKIPEGLIPKNIKNKFTKYYDEDDNVYSGNKKGLNLENIVSWTSDYDVALGFSKIHGSDGMIYQMDKFEFKHRFNFVSMDLLYEYLLKNSIGREMDIKLNEQYNPESELVVLSIKNKVIVENKKDIIIFNSDDKIKIGYNGIDRNKIFYDDKFIGWFGIRYIGDVKLSDVVNFVLSTDVENDIIFKNSIVFEGGFEIKNEYQRKGFGKRVISKIFNDNPIIQNILLYALEEQNAVGYWLKIGGKILLEEEGVVFLNLKRENF